MIGSNFINLFAQKNSQKTCSSNPQFNAISFKGWTYKTDKVFSGYKTDYNSSSTGTRSAESVYIDKVVNKHWEDAVDTKTDIKLYEKDGDTSDNVSNYNRVSDLLAQRAKQLLEKSDKYKKAGVECQQEAVDLKEKAVILYREQENIRKREELEKVEKDIAAKEKELQELRNKHRTLKGEN